MRPKAQAQALADFAIIGLPFSPPPGSPLCPALLNVFEIVFLSLFVILRIAESLWLIVIPTPFDDGNRERE
jgi:hypothetical protein